MKVGGKYEMATLDFVEETPLERSTAIELVKAAVALHAVHGDPTKVTMGAAAEPLHPSIERKDHVKR